MKHLGYLFFVLCCTLLAGCEESSSSSTSVNGSGSDSDTGTGGSTARMTIIGDYLYAIANDNIQLFDIQSPATPNPWVQVRVDWNIETLFPYNDYLLVGAADGMHILDNTDPASPVVAGDFQHATAIDPVVAEREYAYVTLRRDFTQPDNGLANQMNVVDIKDVTNPLLIRTIPMQAPGGLSVKNNRLFVCDGKAGLKTFDLTDPANPVAVHSVPDMDCSDVIATDDTLIAISAEGLSQYDLTTGVPMLLSHLDTEPVIYVVDR